MQVLPIEVVISEQQKDGVYNKEERGVEGWWH